MIFIALLAALSCLVGIFSGTGPGSFIYESIRGEMVEIYGKGIYKQMSADVAIQGIAQDYITCFLGIPLLLAAFFTARCSNSAAHLLLTGVLGYFLVTFTFYTAMGMYNYLFLAYVALMGLSFFAFILSIMAFDVHKLYGRFSKNTPARFTGGFLILNSLIIAVLWLGQVVPPLLDGTIYPDGLQHYTTLIVQGFDLGLLLPLSFVVGLLLYKRKAEGYLYGSIYVVFLAVLMTALTAKIIAMGLNGVNIIPAVFIIPLINIITILLAFLMLRNITTNQ